MPPGHDGDIAVRAPGEDMSAEVNIPVGVREEVDSAEVREEGIMAAVL